MWSGTCLRSCPSSCQAPEERQGSHPSPLLRTARRRTRTGRKTRAATALVHLRPHLWVSPLPTCRGNAGKGVHSGRAPRVRGRRGDRLCTNSPSPFTGASNATSAQGAPGLSGTMRKEGGLLHPQAAPDAGSPFQRPRRPDEAQLHIMPPVTPHALQRSGGFLLVSALRTACSVRMDAGITPRSQRRCGICCRGAQQGLQGECVLLGGKDSMSPKGGATETCQGGGHVPPGTSVAGASCVLGSVQSELVSTKPTWVLLH